MSGGRTTPAGRTDVAAGAAIRVPVGDLSTADPLDPEDLPQEQALATAAPGGVVPLGSVRHGLSRSADMGAQIAGSTLQLFLRGRWNLPSMFWLMAGIIPHAGYLGGLDSEGPAAFRAGGTVPIVLALDLFSVYELWLGARLGIEHVRGEREPGLSLEQTAIRTGGLVGLAVGFRRVWVGVELAVDHEWWTGHIGDEATEVNGVVLTPGFTVRLRL